MYKMADGIILAIDNGIARMTFDRPVARNAMTSDIIQAMIAFLRGLEYNQDVRAILIAGKGDNFMAGGDIKGMAGVLAESEEYRRANLEQRAVDAAPLFLTLERLPQPVVVSARGFAAGVALSFIAGADLTIVSNNAQFLLAHVGIGLCPDGGTTWHVPRAIGVRKAKELAFFGDRFDAEEALRMGLVNRIVPDAELEDQTEKLLKRLVSAPSVSIAQSKYLINRAAGVSLADQLAAEGKSLGLCGQSLDFSEGVKAFLEKRKPAFKGR
jgi:2-(1,2-epoxy-1,2-dihydrophenyl)acetyl-CoA isomerase